MDIFFWIDSCIITYFFLVNAFLIVLLYCSILELRKSYIEMSFVDMNQLFYTEHLPPITTIITTFNEAATILDVTYAALNVDYPHAPVIVMINGSDDMTLELMIKTYQLIVVPPAVPQLLKVGEIKNYFRSETHPQLLVIDKVKKAKGDAVTAAVNAVMTPYYVAIDGDTYIEKNAYRNMARRLLMSPNVVAIAGSLRISNGSVFEKGEIKKVGLPKGFLESIQTLEYLRAFVSGRAGWNRLGGAYLISGALGLFNKQAVIEVGGLDRFFGEDLDITMRLYARKGEKGTKDQILHVQEGMGWTDVPTTLRRLGRQRARWHMVLFDAIARNLNMLFNPKYWPTGFVHLPYLIFIEALGPFVEAFGYIYIIFSLMHQTFSFRFFILFLLLAWGFTVLISLVSLTLEGLFWKKYSRVRDIGKLCLLSAVEIFGYRQLTIWWRIYGGICFFFKKRRSW